MHHVNVVFVYNHSIFCNVTVQCHLNAIATTTCTALHVSECILHVHVHLYHDVRRTKDAATVYNTHIP